jgi:hypothetical protein
VYRQQVSSWVAAAPESRTAARPGSRIERCRSVGPSLIAVVVASAIFFVIVSRGFLFVADQPEQSRFYENQARSLLHGHVDVPLAALGVESIVVGGKYYGYFGPTPAILRLPMMVFTSQSMCVPCGGYNTPYFPGTPFFAPWYMTAAFVLAGIAIAGIAARLRIYGWMAGAFTFVGLAGSALMLLGERALVYEEATLWAACFALVTIWAGLHLLETRTVRWAVIAGTAATLALSARPTSGLAACAVILAVAVLRRMWWLLIGTAVAALGLYASISLWKYGALYPPQGKQIDCAAWPKCYSMQAAGGSSQPKFIPTNVFQYLRPDHLRFGAQFPFIYAPTPGDAPIRLIGIHRYLGTDAMSSVSATMPALLTTSIVGFVVARQDRRWLILASCVGPLVTCMYFGATQRYLADFVPTLIVASACGVAYLLTSRWRRVSYLILAAFSVWSIIVCIALALGMWWHPVPG